MNKIQSFSESERRIAKAINSFPFIKKQLKLVYQVINYVFHRKKYKYISKFPLESISSEFETFFGYYDKSPISPTNRYILFHESMQQTSKTPTRGKGISICLFDLKENKISYKRSVNSYNWQQGARPQWLGERKFIFNNFDEKLGYHSIIAIISADSLIEEYCIPYPIYDCYRDLFALSLNFKRLNVLRPDYGYRNHHNTPDIKNLFNDGVFFIDLATKDSYLLVSLEEIRKTETNNHILNADNHKVNHIMISPDGTRFMFLHRYFFKRRRYDRLMIYDFEKKELEVLVADGMVSHCCWLNNETIIGYFRDKFTGDKYYKLNIKTKQKQIIGNGIINKYGDGHPSTHNGLMLFDTYPDKARMKKLFIYNLKASELFELGEFYESLLYRGETRCDLHPRISFDGKRIFFDSVHDGKRKLYWISIE